MNYNTLSEEGHQPFHQNTLVNHEEVLNVICTLKNNESTDVDGVTTEILEIEEMRQQACLPSCVM